jgi:uncharacterized protein YceK
MVSNDLVYHHYQVHKSISTCISIPTSKSASERRKRAAAMERGHQRWLEHRQQWINTVRETCQNMTIPLVLLILDYHSSLIFTSSLLPLSETQNR